MGAAARGPGADGQDVALIAVVRPWSRNALGGLLSLALGTVTVLVLGCNAFPSHSKTSNMPVARRGAGEGGTAQQQSTCLACRWPRVQSPIKRIPGNRTWKGISLLKALESFCQSRQAIPGSRKAAVRMKSFHMFTWSKSIYISQGPEGVVVQGVSPASFPGGSHPISIWSPNIFLTQKMSKQSYRSSPPLLGGESKTVRYGHHKAGH